MSAKKLWGGMVPFAAAMLAMAAQSCGSATVNDGAGGGSGHAGTGGAAGMGGASTGGTSMGRGGTGGSGTGGTTQSAGGQSGSGAAGTTGAGTGGAVTSTGGASGAAGTGGQPATGGAGPGGRGGGAAGKGGTAGGGAAGTAGGATGGTTVATGGTTGVTGGASGAAGGASGATGGASGAAGGTAGAAGGAAGKGGTGGAGTPNVVFVSSRVDLKSNLGSLGAYDAVCNQLATAAGINNATHDAFVALLGDSHTSALSRLGNARGFVRTDGAPVADDLTSLFSQNRLFNVISTNEHGVPQPFSAVLDGLQDGGTTDPTSLCSDWTTATGPASFTAGCSSCGPPVWYYWEHGTCDYFTGAVYCFMNTHTAPLTITPVAGKKIFVTNGPVMAGQDADAACTTSKPAGTGTVKALRATTTAAASGLINASAKYVRPDGILVAAGSDLTAAKLSSGIWQQGNGAYTTNVAVWTGAADLSTVGTAATTCANWTSTASTDSAAWGATAGDIALGWWQGGASQPCNSTYTFAYCIEQ